MQAEKNNTKQKGEVAEAVVLAELLKLGFTVLLPHGDNQRYDLVVDFRKTFVRLQVRRARLDKKSARLEFTTKSSRWSGKAYRLTYYTKEDVDFFAAWCPGPDKVYIVPIEEAGRSSVTLRLGPTRNGQVKRTRQAVDYELQQGSFD